MGGQERKEQCGDSWSPVRDGVHFHPSVISQIYLGDIWVSIWGEGASSQPWLDLTEDSRAEHPKFSQGKSHLFHEFPIFEGPTIVLMDVLFLPVLGDPGKETWGVLTPSYLLPPRSPAQGLPLCPGMTDPTQDMCACV